MGLRFVGLACRCGDSCWDPSVKHAAAWNCGGYRDNADDDDDDDASAYASQHDDDLDSWRAEREPYV